MPAPIPFNANWYLSQNPDVAAAYDELFALYLETYENTKRVVHELARLQRTERSTK